MAFWEWIKSWFKKKESPSPTPISTPEPVSSSSPAPAPTRPENPPPIPPAPANKPPKRPSDLPASNHYASRDRKKLALEYAYLWSIATVTDRWLKEVRRSVQWARANKAQFQKVTEATGVPWFVVAIINIMEMGTDLSGTLLNGDPWNKKTVHYPSGKGPWKSWLEAAIYAIESEEEGWHFNLKTYTWDVGGVFYYLEAWNGFNARIEPQYGLTTPKGASPYIYSGTPFYVKGKKQEMPTRFDPELVSAQIGCMAFLKELENQGEKLF